MYFADLHIHSRFSRATSRDCNTLQLERWARRKGLGLIGTGDFTHAQWRAELRETLLPAEDGLYRLRDDLRLPDNVASGTDSPRFVLSGEISSIYKKDGKTRKVHNVILLPNLEAADALAARLEAIGNIHSDGRPILGLDCRDLLEITLDVCPTAVFIPAHIWTPHFSLFGAFSDFHSVEECFGDMTPYIHAMETGLSSDPAMNWRVSLLDRYTLVSNSDAHSPSKLAREANILTGERSYPTLTHALQSGEGFGGTLEFFPEEGKYHWDGHRNCGRCCSPEEAAAFHGICPDCGKKMTIGVEHRVDELADRPRGFVPPNAKPFESLVPLPEVIAATTGVSATAQRTLQPYEKLLSQLGSELFILRQVPPEEIERVAGPIVRLAVERLRAGQVTRRPGYDGEYGVISLFTPEELEDLRGEQRLFDVAPCLPATQKTSAKRYTTKTPPSTENATNQTTGSPQTNKLNPEQWAAVTATARTVAVIAGPGSGKTKTLIERIAYLIEKRNVHPSQITAVTFTNQAAAELKARLRVRLAGGTAVEQLTAGTFHQLCLGLLPPKTLVDEVQKRDLLAQVMTDRGRTSPSLPQLAEQISRWKNGLDNADPDPELLAAYSGRLRALNCRDLDDLLLEALELDVSTHANFDYLLVDEYQDVNPLQRQLIAHWRTGGELFVIGDPDQSIYGFRGADAHGFEHLAATYPDLQTVTLTHNYRSTPEILTAAASIWEKAEHAPKTLLPTLPAGVPVRKGTARTALAEGIWLAGEIARLTGGLDMLTAGRSSSGEKTRAFSELAILCRTRRQLHLIEDCLRHDDIPCIVMGRDKFLEDDSVRGCLAFFRSLLTPEDNHNRTLCCRLLRQSPAEHKYETDETPLELEFYRRACAEFAPRIATERPAALIASWRQKYCDSDGLDKLCQTAALYDDLSSLLDDVMLGGEGDLRRAAGHEYSSGAVRLLTLHGAKGLEFPVVFLAGVSEGELPLTRGGIITDEAEEHRLFYVGLTRAKEELIVTSGGTPSPLFRSLAANSFRITTPAPREIEPTLF